MTRVLLMVLFAFVSYSAIAEWDKTDENEEFTFYVDWTASISKDNVKDNVIKFWQLKDFKSVTTIDRFNVLSIKYLDPKSAIEI